MKNQTDKHLTQDEAIILEKNENVYIMAEAELYNRESRDAIYGWKPIPLHWLSKAGIPNR